MEHLAPGATHGATKTRRLTPDEKAMYRAINPYITDEELSKVTTPILGKKIKNTKEQYLYDCSKIWLYCRL